jgi:nucleotide-binding universal stress UspA family protein
VDARAAVATWPPNGDDASVPDPARRPPVVPFRHIACCVDDSPASMEALAEAVALRDLCGARLSVVHVVPRPLLMERGPGEWVPAPEDLVTRRRAWLAGLAAEIPEAEPVALTGNPPSEVCDWAAGTDVDLLLAASHRGRVQRALLGSFATHLAQRAPCAVLLTRPGAAPPRPPSGA